MAEKEKPKKMEEMPTIVSVPSGKLQSLKRKIKTELKETPEPYAVLVLTQPANHFNNYLDILEISSKEEGSTTGICVTLTRTVESLIKLLEARNIDTEKIFFIDCISKISGAKQTRKNCFYVSHPSNLTDMSIALTKAIENTGAGKKFFIVDSWSSLLIYNERKKVLGFSNFIINKLRANEINGFLITLSVKSDEEFAQGMSVFCDKVLVL